ncbi:serine/threonine protein kinase [Chryseobacterium geocarposphaerae]|uniref:Serine/threonine protein kinase n=1 Tax=Chryseobacterium geocarposphaerae TaxID=1416776 RepID=A0A2M9C7H7_9FLAO|nr:protein kinase [Chryseobacterium geocarposphaerae]PJJ66773.1 serine/threonine protein kinase [Chryseobacterium geocarposphaerae]
MLTENLQKKYNLIKEYAEGGQSVTFLVEKDSIKYIIKIPKSVSLSKERRFRLEREIKALELMNGFGVPKLHDYSSEEEVYIVMDFISGLTLNEFVEKNTLDLKTSVLIVTSLCEIIEEAHKIGLYHRDLKPDNIIIENTTNRPFIIDFGICWLDDNSSFKTKKGIELGNRFLRLPELAKGTDVTVSASDITFLVGILFYLVTKHQPNILLNEEGLQPHKRSEVRDLEVLSNNILKKIFDKGFTYEVSLRYSTASELKEDLNKILLPMTTENLDFDASKKLDELFNDEFYKKKRANIEIIKECHNLFLSNYQQSLNASLNYGGNNANFSEETRSVETSMFVVQRGTSEPNVRFYLVSKFNDNFDIVYLTYGTETFNDQVSHTIKETTKMETLYPEIGKLLAENTMNELLPKIQSGLR